VVEGETSSVPRMRLFVNLVRLQAGRAAEAHLDLYEWSRQGHCPSLARVLLAGLEAADGEYESARWALDRNLGEEHDPLSLQLMLLLDIDQQLSTSGANVAGFLANHFGHHAPTVSVLQTLEIDDQLDSERLPLELVDELAGSLAARPQLIPTLTEAQKRAPNPSRIELLRRAVLRILDELDEPRQGCESLAELSRLAGHQDDARRWARRGLAYKPYSAKLALMLDDLDPPMAELLDESQPAPGSSAPIEPQQPIEREVLAILEEVARQRPDWPDVQRAMILRCGHEGLWDEAHRHVDEWLARRPNDPWAQRTAQELAA
jgi:hypothetical protein